MTQEQLTATPTRSQTMEALEKCPVCNLQQPFTTAILRGLPLGDICICPIGHRLANTLRLKAPGRVEGH